MDNLQVQKEEIVALQSIYDRNDLNVNQNNPISGRYAACVQLPPKFWVTCNTKNYSRLNLEFLPPITLTFEFPPSYPSDTGPAFRLSCNWLTIKQISQLCQKLDQLTEENSGEVILFHWICFLQNDVFTHLGITDELDITELCSYNMNCTLHGRQQTDSSKNICSKPVDNQSELVDVLVKSMEPSITGGISSIDCRAFVDLIDGKSLIPVLEYFNKCKKQQIQDITLFTCDVCCLSQLGSNFSSFRECGHRFCKECLKSYFEVQILDGNVHSLNCPDADCKSQADGSQVKELVSKRLFEKYDSMLLSRTLEGMTDVVFCPRKVCQAPLIVESETSMGWCNKCNFVFCVFCRMTHHGVAPCRLKWEEQKDICNQYLEANAEVKESMEKRFGKKALKFLVDNTLSEEWVMSYSKKCPHCQACIEKFEGCNKMTCYQCGTYFCWLCMTELPQANPYHHFSNPKSRCFNQLYPEIENEDTEPGEFLAF